MLNIAVFASGRGSNFEALHRAIREERFPAAIAVVISNNSSAGVLPLAASFGIPAHHISRLKFPDEESFRQHLLTTLRAYHVNFIVLAGYMKKLDAGIIREFPKRIINIHPALLPKFGGEGMYGLNVHRAVIDAGETASGATVHYVDEEYDRGAIIAQRTVPVDPGETPESLAEKVLRIEHTLLPSVVRTFSENVSA